jgi:hypothetical protein
MGSVTSKRKPITFGMNEEGKHDRAPYGANYCTASLWYSVDTQKGTVHARLRYSADKYWDLCTATVQAIQGHAEQI